MYYNYADVSNMYCMMYCSEFGGMCDTSMDCILCIYRNGDYDNDEW